MKVKKEVTVEMNINDLEQAIVEYITARHDSNFSETDLLLQWYASRDGVDKVIVTGEI